MSDPFIFVGSSNLEKAFTYSQAHTIKNIIDGSKFIKNEIYYDVINNYIYLFNFEGGKIAVRDVFSNPSELLELNDCDGKPCIDSIFIEDDMKRLIKQFILEEFRSVRQIPEQQELKINEA